MQSIKTKNGNQLLKVKKNDKYYYFYIDCEENLLKITDSKEWDWLKSKVNRIEVNVYNGFSEVLINVICDYVDFYTKNNITNYYGVFYDLFLDGTSFIFKYYHKNSNCSYTYTCTLRTLKLILDSYNPIGLYKYLLKFGIDYSKFDIYNCTKWELERVLSIVLESDGFGFFSVSKYENHETENK